MKNPFPVIVLLVLLALLALWHWSSRTAPQPAPKPAPQPAPTPGLAEPAPPPPALESGSRENAQPSNLAESQGLHGTLRSFAAAKASARAVPGARVRWQLDGLSLGETISDADGRYSLPLAAYFACTPLSRERGQLTIEARANGFQPLRQSVPRPPEGAERLALDLVLLPGSTLRGRVLDLEQRAVPGASVQLLAASQQAGREVRVPVASAETNAQGEYELGFVSSATLELFAKAPQLGTAWRTLELEAGADARAEDLTLRGAGELSGHARFTDGTAVADLELWAVPEAVAVQPNALILCVERALEFERDAGLFSTRCITDSDGAFRLSGLIPGKYMLRTPTSEVVFEPRFGYYNSGTHGITLSVETQRLRVEVLDGAGAPLIGAQVVLSELNDAGDGSFEAGQIWFARARGARATASFNVQPETTYGLRVQTRGLEPFEDLVLLAPGEFEQSRSVTLAPAAEPARLRLVLSSPLGLVKGARVQRLSPLTGALDLDLGLLTANSEGWIEGLPPGEQSFAIGFADSLEEPNWHLPVARTAKVQLPAGGARELHQELALGARLELAIAVEGTLGAAPQYPTREARLAEQGAFVSFEPEGQPERPLNFFGPDGRVESQLLPGAAARGVELLLPGRGTLKVQVPGCFLATQSVELAPGAYTRVAIKARARS